jgi:rhodanese-related sulfurtransferase
MENVNINAWVDMKNDNAVLLDVRTIEEFNEGHITGALNIDVFSPNFQAEVEKLDTSKDYYIVCRSGGRSMSAGGAMESMGFTKVTNMAGGMMAWMGEQVY